MFDLYKMAHFKNYTNTRQLLLKQFVILVPGQNNVFVPMIKFKRLISRKKSSAMPYTFCPFLINTLEDDGQLKGYCQLHPRHKPLICGMAPVGRFVDLDTSSEKYVFVKPAPDCAGLESDQQNSLDELKKSFKKDLEYEIRFFRILRNIADKQLSKNEIIETLYSFDVQLPFKETLQHIEEAVFN